MCHSRAAGNPYSATIRHLTETARDSAETKTGTRLPAPCWTPSSDLRFAAARPYALFDQLARTFLPLGSPCASASRRLSSVPLLQLVRIQPSALPLERRRRSEAFSCARVLGHSDSPRSEPTIPQHNAGTMISLTPAGLNVARGLGEKLMRCRRRDSTLRYPTLPSTCLYQFRHSARQRKGGSPAGVTLRAIGDRPSPFPSRGRRWGGGAAGCGCAGCGSDASGRLSRTAPRPA